jgi:hypothetical protein
MANGYNGPDRRKTDRHDRRHESWHLDKRINIGHILTTLAIAGSVFLWGSAIDRRVALLEQAQATSKEANKELFVEIKNSLIRIEARLNTKADKFILPKK